MCPSPLEYAFSRPSVSVAIAEVQFFFTPPSVRVVIDTFGRPDSSMVEQLTFNQLVPGSSPGLATPNTRFVRSGSSLPIKMHLLLKFRPRLALIHIPLSGWIAQW